MKKTTIFIVLATLCLISKLNAQIPIRLTGQLHSGNGKPLSGATLVITDTKLSTTTDELGNFIFPTAPPKGTISVSYTGYISQTISFNQENRNLKIILNSKENSLEDIQINAGYYSVKDKERTGTIAKVNAATIANQPVSNPLAALQGRVAGLVITQRNGLPGSDFNVQLRGRSSIQSGTSPLYLINGVPFPSETVAQVSTIFANSPLNTINPADIESIEVLKDADATAIYGSRGANGVILITTKKGKAGSTKAELNLSAGAGQITRGIEMMDTREYLQMRREAFANDKITPTIANAPDLLAWDTNRDQNFPNLLTGGTAHTQNAQLRLSGGSPLTSYALSANYYKETTVFPGETGLNRKDANLNINHQSPDNRFSLNLSAGYGISVNTLYSSDLSSAVATVPNSPSPYSLEGKLIWSENGVNFSNPLAMTFEPNDYRTNRFNGNAVMGYQLLKSLRLKLTTGFNSTSVNQFTATPIAAQNPSGAPTGYATFGDNFNQTWTAEPQIDYSLNLKRYGNLSMLLGGTWQGTFTRGTLVQASGYTNDLLIGSMAAAATRTPTNSYADYRYQAVFARINYNYESKYLINLTARRDGSSRFGPGKRFANFGALGAAWVFSEEEIIRDKLSFLSFGKIRASYGLTGNDQINNYQYLDSYIPSLSYAGQTGLYPNRLFNDSYGWESNKKLEVNLELGLLKDRIRISTGFFRNLSGNQLVSYSLPGQTGFSSILQNLDARIENRGLEIELNTVNLKGKTFTWSTSANLTFARNRLLEFPGLAASSYASTYFIGEALNVLQGYHYTGINQTTGAYQFQDKNGDGQLNTLDYYLLGTKDPRFYGGFSNTFMYKGFFLDIFFQFAKQKGTDLIYGASGLVGSRNNVPKALLDRWSPSNPGAKYQAYSQSNSGPINTARPLIRLSDAAIVDASYIRLKNVAFSYSLSEKTIKKTGLSSAKISLQAQNLLTITPYEGLDPESQSPSTLPPLRMVSIGLQLIL
ncbi:SusC/RagA family TonB-linked outer membrane protein [Pedobacter psychrodurus]|uniref:SusC/RagA family TonB-linked outer membrane protein n=1 Tax=Pedobacter psychrodurus TaxID=2530456 RepID=A0A4R0PZE9_9SPHI|nr:SusC/RagA family TonB-linked outer membrane protein [Pedobacter psychrodurus]TCD28630.1 SusC/RagA family TonB-linked outer membrane protein [Pedobacter psychrodurus]